MGYTTSTVHGIEVPDSSEANNVPEDIGKVVTALEAGSIVKRLTSAQISALTSPQKPAGLVVYNTTTGKLQISNGTSFADFAMDAAVYAIGTRVGALTLSYGGATTVTWTAETDPYGFLGSSDATLPSAGLWLVTGFADCGTTDSSSGFFQLQIHQNGSAVASASTTYNVAGGDGIIACTTALVAAASDTVRLRIWNSYTSGTTNCTSARMTVHKIGS